MSYSNNVVNIAFENCLSEFDLYNINFSCDKESDVVSFSLEYDFIVHLLETHENLNCGTEDIVDVKMVEHPKTALVVTLKEMAETYDPDYDECFDEGVADVGNDTDLNREEMRALIKIDGIEDDISDLEDDVHALKNFRTWAMTKIEKLEKEVQVLKQPKERIGW